MVYLFKFKYAVLCSTEQFIIKNEFGKVCWLLWKVTKTGVWRCSSNGWNYIISVLSSNFSHKMEFHSNVAPFGTHFQRAIFIKFSTFSLWWIRMPPDELSSHLSEDMPFGRSVLISDDILSINTAAQRREKNMADLSVMMMRKTEECRWGGTRVCVKMLKSVYKHFGRQIEHREFSHEKPKFI